VNEIAEAIDRLTRAVDGQDSSLDLWSGIVIPIAVSLISSGLVLFVLAFQHRARRIELRQEEHLRAEERAEWARNRVEEKRAAAVAARKAATRKAASAFISGINSAHTLNALRRNPSQADIAQVRIAEAFRDVHDAALLDLEDEEHGIIVFVVSRMKTAYEARSAREAAEAAGGAATQIRRWMRGEVDAADLKDGRDAE
jgi:hypothetical protein